MKSKIFRRKSCNLEILKEMVNAKARKMKVPKKELKGDKLRDVVKAVLEDMKGGVKECETE